MSDSIEGPYQSAFDATRDPERAANLKIRSKLATKLSEYVECERLTQKEAAEKLDVSQSRVSRLLNGRISQFTIDALVNMCSSAGLRVDVTFEEDAPAAS